LIKQLLIANSDAFVRDRCRRYFTNRGYQVELAADGLECLDALSRIPPDILVLEQELLWGGGEGVLACLREDRLGWPGAVILTSHELVVGPPRRLEPPVKALLQKPFSLGALFETVRRAQYGETQLASRFLRHAAALERHWRDWGSAFDPPRPPRFGGGV
jgi:DNA-binding NtrC family response regulator